MATEPYSQGYAPSVLTSQTWRNAANSAAHLLPHLESGQRLLDVGCGPGTLTVDLAARVAPGQVLGVDIEASVVVAARQAAAEAGLDNVVVAVADLADLPEAGAWDVVHAHQVLLHVPDPVAALRHLMAAARPGGIVAVRDTDYAGMAWWPELPGLERWRSLYREVARANGTEPDAGRRLLAWARAAGATDVTPGASVWCHATPAERERWGGSWATRILDSTVANRALDGGLATRADLEEISEAWRTWTADPDGWFMVPHGDVIIRV